MSAPSTEPAVDSLDCLTVNDSWSSGGNFTNSTQLDLDAEYEEQRQALMYIVVVLLFYSTSIITLMVKYMRKEREQWMEDEMYRNFLAKARLIAMQESKFQWSRTISLQLQRSGWANNSISSVNSGSTVNAGDYNSMPTINPPDSGRSSFSTSISVSPAAHQPIISTDIPPTALLGPPATSRNRSASSSMINPMDSSTPSTSVYLTQPHKDERSRSLPIQGHAEILRNSALLLPSVGRASRKSSATSVKFAVDYEDTAKRDKVSIV